MLTESFVTQCPHCQTRFRVTRAQLGMARGAVRCGACLQVFNAAEQLNAEPEAEQPAPSATGIDREQLRSAVTRAAAGTLAAGALHDASAMQPPQEPQQAAEPLVAPDAPAAASHSLELDDDQPTPPPYKPVFAPAFETAFEPAFESAREPAPTPVPKPVDKPGDDDTLWIHDDLDLDALDLELDDELAKLEHNGLELSSEFRDLQPTHAPFGSAHDNRPDPHDESWVEALLNEPDGAKTLTTPQRPFDEPPLEPEYSDPDFPELDDDRDELERHPRSDLVAERDEPISVSDAAASLAAGGAAAAAGRRSEPRLRDEGLLNLNDEPLQLDWQAPRANWGRRLLWLLLILLAIGGLAAQYTYYNFDKLSRQEQLRPWFERLCPLLGCELPPRVDVSQVKSSNLTVRNHPSHPGALTVDAIIYNRATFAQPFPLLELRFEDINGQPLASRSFKPSEYLAGELAGQTDMPPQTPIHIALEIVDPGTRAVNYRLAFHSPD